LALSFLSSLLFPPGAAVVDLVSAAAVVPGHGAAVVVAPGAVAEAQVASADLVAEALAAAVVQAAGNYLTRLRYVRLVM